MIYVELKTFNWNIVHPRAPRFNSIKFMSAHELSQRLSIQKFLEFKLVGMSRGVETNFTVPKAGVN